MVVLYLGFIVILVLKTGCRFTRSDEMSSDHLSKAQKEHEKRKGNKDVDTAAFAELVDQVVLESRQHHAPSPTKLLHNPDEIDQEDYPHNIESESSDEEMEEGEAGNMSVVSQGSGPVHDEVMTMNSDSETHVFSDDVNSDDDSSTDEENLQLLLADDEDYQRIVQEVEETLKEPEDELKRELAVWSMQNNIRSTALTQLLKIFIKNGHPTFPKSSKTLLKTPRITIKAIKDLRGGGKFWYYGIEEAVSRKLTPEYLSTLADNCIVVDIFVDGLSPYKSVRKQLWPIAGCIVGQKTPFVIAMWCGETKEPKDLEAFWEDYIQEAGQLITNGFSYKGNLWKFKIRNYLADAPARAWLKAVNPHNSKICCERCTVEGMWVSHRMIYEADEECALRSDDTFLNQEQERYHRGQSPLLRLQTKMISQVPLDPMHMIYLGAMKRILGRFLMKKKSRYKLKPEEVDNLSQVSIALAEYIPSEFSRKPRTLSDWKLYKATEYRRLLLYDGFVLFKKFPHVELFTNFLLLACPIRILSDPQLVDKFADDADKLLKIFVEHSKQIFGESFLVYNIHHLTHLADECKRHGTLEEFSCFKYENHFRLVLLCLHAPGRTLPQLVCRVMERASNLPEECATPSIEYPLLEQPHHCGPTLDDCGGQQFQKVKLQDFVFRLSRNDSYCLLKSGHVVCIQNFVACKDGTFIIGRKFRKKEDYFTYPFPSSLIDVFKVYSLSPRRKWRFEEIKTKVVLLPLNPVDGDVNWEENVFVCLPLLHKTTDIV